MISLPPFFPKKLRRSGQHSPALRGDDDDDDDGDDDDDVCPAVCKMKLPLPI